MKKQLVKSEVKFFEDEHRYFTPDGKELSGITKMIRELVFPHKYEGVSETVLRSAAERGTLIHHLCEEFAINGTVSSFMPDEVSGFVSLVSNEGIKFTDAEHLVSDGEHFATMIDLVDDKNNLYDIKTTSTLDIEYLSWQLSTAACLFEMQNPGIEAGKLFAIWLRDDRCEIREVQRYPDDAVEALMLAWIEGTEFINPMTQLSPEQQGSMQQVAELENQIIKMEESVKELKKMRDKYTTELLRQMIDKGVKSWETDNLKLTVKAGYVRNSVDSKKLQENHPDIYKECLKSTNVKESLLITLK